MGSDLVDVLNSCYRSGSLSLSQRRGIITLTFKKGDRLDACNWRLISLLNVDYKIAARAIAGHLLNVIHLVVEKDQTCGVPGRYIGENVAFLRDVVSYPMILRSLFSLSTRRRLLIGWIGVFFCLLFALWFMGLLLSTGFVCFTRMLRALSMLMVTYPLFSLCLVVSVKAVICAVFRTYDRYERGSGSKLNMSKSWGLWLGPWCWRLDAPVDLDWASIKIKVLGVYIVLGILLVIVGGLGFQQLRTFCLLGSSAFSLSGTGLL